MSPKLVLWTAVLPLAASAAGKVGRLPVHFVPNHGQLPGNVLFMASGSGLNAQFSPNTVAYSVNGRSIHVEFLGASGPQVIEPAGRLPGEANFLFGAEGEWRAGVPIYENLLYRNLYPGIDMKYGSQERNLKSEFIVSPEASPQSIRFRYVGSTGVEIAEDGSLEAHFGRQILREQAPVAFQWRRGTKVRVAARFEVTGDVVGFSIGDYDSALPLVIDPTLSYLTLLGGAGSNAAMSVAVDASGSAYLAGHTSALNFPTNSAVQSASGGGNEVFVAKLSPSGTSLVYCTYIGGRGDDRAYGIAVDSGGAAYIAGATTSTNFPVKGAVQPSLGGGKDAFVLKLAPSGNYLVFSTYLGGNADDAANGVATDASGNAYIAGETASANFPAFSFQPAYRGGTDAFVAKLSADGVRLLYSTYLGGSAEDRATAVAVDSTGAASITGSTYSLNLPVANAYQAASGGGQDAFVCRLSPNGTSLLFSTYFGGSGGITGQPEAGQGIAVDAQGNAYVTGVTSSSNLPMKSALQARNAGWQDAFATKWSANGTLLYSTYIGGVNIDIGYAIAVDTTGSAYVAGGTTSANLASVTGGQTTTTGSFDAFVVKLTPAGDALAALVYLGGSGDDTASAITADAWGNVYVAGWTLSPTFPTGADTQVVNVDNYGAFVAKLTLGAVPVITVTPASATVYAAQSAQFTATVTNTTNTAVTWSLSPAGSGTISSTGLYTAPSSLSSPVTVTITATTVATPIRTASATVTVPGGLAVIATPTPGSVFSSGGATFSWTSAAGADQYWLDVGTAIGTGDIWRGSLTATSQVVSGIPCNHQTVYVQLYTHLNGAWMPPQRYTYTAAASCASPYAQMIWPPPQSALADRTVTFAWSAAAGADQYWLDVGTSLGAGDISAGTTTGTSVTVTGLPCDGRTLYVQLYTHLNGAWAALQRYTYAATSICTPTTAHMISPAPLTMLNSTTVTFTWTAAAGADQYWLDVGSSLGSGDILAVSTPNTSRIVTGVPCDGRPLFVQLYTHRNGAWAVLERYTYTASASCR